MCRASMAMSTNMPGSGADKEWGRNIGSTPPCICQTPLNKFDKYWDKNLLKYEHTQGGEREWKKGETRRFSRNGGGGVG